MREREREEKQHAWVVRFLCWCVSISNRQTFMQTNVAHNAYMYTYIHTKHSKHTNKKSCCTYMHKQRYFQEHTCMHTNKQTKISPNRHSRIRTYALRNTHSNKQTTTRTHTQHTSIHPSINPYSNTHLHTYRESLKKSGGSKIQGSLLFGTNVDY